MASIQIALWRGINVGKAKRIAMAELRSVLERLGFENVRTLLNSGNAVFAVSGGAPRALPARIERAVADELGVVARVMIVSGRELDAMIAANPLLDIAHDFSRHLVGVFATPADAEPVRPLLDNDWGADRLALHGRAAYLWCEQGILDSPLAQAFNRAAKDMVTTRNWATMLKLQALAAG